MIIFGQPIHRKYNRLVVKIVAIIFVIVISIGLMSCSKIDFDPTTSALKYIIKKESKNEQPIK